MNGPDGPEQRTADDAEYYEGQYDAIERIEQREREQGEEALLDLAQARMMAWAVDRILR